jgi:hypothetical protein
MALSATMEFSKFQIGPLPKYACSSKNNRDTTATANPYGMTDKTTSNNDKQ